MEISIKILSSDQEYSIEQTKSLTQFLRDAVTSDLQLELERREQNRDEAGTGEIIGIVAAILGAPAVVELAKALRVWVTQRQKIKKATQKEMKIELKNKLGEQIKISVKNYDDSEEEVIDKITKFLG